VYLRPIKLLFDKESRAEITFSEKSDNSHYIHARILNIKHFKVENNNTTSLKFSTQTQKTLIRTFLF